MSHPAASSPSWVYIFSQFTPEALIFEGFLIFLLLGGYAAFWMLKRRRLGVIKEQVPAGLVKEYLAALIQDATMIRTHLFGLIQGATDAAASGKAAIHFESIIKGSGPGLSELEGKLAEQQKSLEGVLAEKAALELSLAEAKKGVASGAGNKALEDKLALLEGKLAEYSIIEDDLANLKRLTQENAALKAQLAKLKAGGAVAAEEPTPAPPAPAAAAPAPLAPPPAEVPAPAADALAAVAAAEAARATEQSIPPPATLGDPQGESISSPLDGLDGAPTPAELDLPTPVAAQRPEEAVQPVPPPAAAPSGGTDADLVAEFEKMLSG